MMPRKRRGRGEGSVFQRADGLWAGSISAGYDGNGKRNRRTAYGKTKHAVQEKLRELERETPSHGVAKVTVAGHLNHWLENTARNKVAPTTWLRYEQIARLHIVPYIGGLRLSKLAPMHVEQLFARQESNGVSARNRELSGVVLNSSCRHAVRLKLIAHNPCSDVAKPRAPKREMQVWDVAQSQRFLDEAASDRLFALYVLAIATGMRQGELFALVWSDMDFGAEAILVQRTLEEVSGRLRLKEAKTAKSRRRIDLPKFSIEALHDHRKRMLAEGHAAAPVFCSTRGGHLRKSNFYRRSYQRILKRAELPAIRFHDLRHTSATLLLLQGENPKVVSERLGHASVEFTLSVYSHVLPTMQKAAAERLEKLFG